MPACAMHFQRHPFDQGPSLLGLNIKYIAKYYVGLGKAV